jgi:hypothetical protein
MSLAELYDAGRPPRGKYLRRRNPFDLGRTGSLTLPGTT